MVSRLADKTFCVLLLLVWNQTIVADDLTVVSSAQESAAFRARQIFEESQNWLCVYTIYRIYRHPMPDYSPQDLNHAGGGSLDEMATYLSNGHINSVKISHISQEALESLGLPAIIEVSSEGQRNLAIFLPTDYLQSFLYVPPSPPEALVPGELDNWNGVALVPYIHVMPPQLSDFVNTRKQPLILILVIVVALLIASRMQRLFRNFYENGYVRKLT